MLFNRIIPKTGNRLKQQNGEGRGKMSMMAFARAVLTRREHVIALEPKGRGLVDRTLRYPYEVLKMQ